MRDLPPRPLHLPEPDAAAKTGIHHDRAFHSAVSQARHQDSHAKAPSGTSPASNNGRFTNSLSSQIDAAALRRDRQRRLSLTVTETANLPPRQPDDRQD